MKDVQFEVEVIKPKPNEKSQSSWFSFFFLIFICLNIYMIMEIFNAQHDTKNYPAIFWIFLYIKWIALSLASGLPVLILKR